MVRIRGLLAALLVVALVALAALAAAPGEAVERGQCPTSCSTWSDCLEFIDPVHWLSGEVHLANGMQCTYEDVYGDYWTGLMVE